MDKIVEKWEWIPKYEGLYKVSTHGRIMSCGHPRRSFGQTKTRINKGSYDKCGYCLVVCCRDNKIERFLLHRIVASLFIPNPLSLPCINHIDGNPRNNRVENLEWCTLSQNMKHAYATGLSVNPNKRRVCLLVDGTPLMEFESMKECSKYFGKGEGWLAGKRQDNRMQYEGYQIVCAPPLWQCKLTDTDCPSWVRGK